MDAAFILRFRWKHAGVTCQLFVTRQDELTGLAQTTEAVSVSVSVLSSWNNCAEAKANRQQKKHVRFSSDWLCGGVSRPLPPGSSKNINKKINRSEGVQFLVAVIVSSEDLDSVQSVTGCLMFVPHPQWDVCPH